MKASIDSDRQMLVAQDDLARVRADTARAAEDVENALTALVQSAEEVRELTRETASLKRAADAAEEAYRGGAVSLIDEAQP